MAATGQVAANCGRGHGGAPDLSVLANENGGAFPITYVDNVIDGREAFKAHGTRDMPIWGRTLSHRAAPHYDGYVCDADVFVRGRILSFIDYRL